MHQNHTHIQTDPRTAAAATDHPELYAKTVWGRMKQSPEIDEAVLRNRNRIAEEWRLVRQIEADTLLAAGADVRADLDHAEAYESRKGWIYLLCSNDTRPPPPVLGMKPIPPVYARGVRSFGGRYATKREFRARLEAVACSPSRPRPAGAACKAEARPRHRRRGRRAKSDPTAPDGGIPAPPRLFLYVETFYLAFVAH